MTPSIIRQPCGRHHGVYLNGKPHDNPTPSKITFDDLKEVFLAKEWNSLHLSGKKLDYLHLEHFLKFKLYLHQSLTPPQCKIVVAYCTLNRRVAIEIGLWPIILSLDI